MRLLTTVVESTLLEILIDIFTRTGKIYLGVLVGYLFIVSPLRKYKKGFVDVTMNILTPILIFVSILQVEGSSEAIFPALASVFVTLAGIFLPKIMARGRPVKPAELCTAAFPNALNFPFPLIFALSPSSLGAAGIFLVVQIILRNTIGLWISGVAFTHSNLRDIAKFPPIWSVALGIIARISMGKQIRVSLSTANNAIVYWMVEIGIFATLMTLGFGIHRPNIDHLIPYIRVGLTRFVITPVLFFALLLPFRISAVVMVAMIVQVMAPPAVYNGIYAEKFDLDTNLTSNTIVLLTLLALILVPVEFFLLEFYFL